MHPSRLCTIGYAWIFTRQPCLRALGFAFRLCCLSPNLLIVIPVHQLVDMVSIRRIEVVNLSMFRRVYIVVNGLLDGGPEISAVIYLRPIACHVAMEDVVGGSSVRILAIFTEP